jgi:hypothetical protein
MTEREAAEAAHPPAGATAPTGPEPDAAKRLAEAAARSPELAAMLAAGRIGRRPRRPRRALLVVAGLVLGALAAALGAREAGAPATATASPTSSSPSSPGTLIHPLAIARDAATGEEIAPFSGFALSVETDPPGALVAVDGVVRGESPVFTGLACTPGTPIRVRAEKQGLPAREARTACRADTLVRLTLRLGR